MTRIIPTPIEHCENCRFMIDGLMRKDPNNIGCYCNIEKRFFTENEWLNDECPEWCPFPEQEDNMHQIKCEDCGKFISYKDIDSGNCDSEMVYSGSPIRMPDHKEFRCIECSKIKKKKE